MVRVGLTGGIGAGKSAVARRLAELGAVIVDSDQIAREVLAPGTPGLAAVVARFGTDILLPDGSLDRPKLGGLVFSDEQQRQALNAIVHPLVGERSAALVAGAPPDGVVVSDIPLLVENNLGLLFPLVVVVEAPVDVRVDRLVRTRGMTTAEAAARMAAQATDEQRRAAADVVLVNDADLDSLHAAVDALWRERLLPFAENLARGRRAAGGASAVQACGRLTERLRAVLAPWQPSIDGEGPLYRVLFADGERRSAAVGALRDAGWIVPGETAGEYADPAIPAGLTLVAPRQALGSAAETSA